MVRREGRGSVRGAVVARVVRGRKVGEVEEVGEDGWEGFLGVAGGALLF